MTCRWIFPCHRTPTVFYLGGFFCSYHARLIQGFKASRVPIPAAIGTPSASRPPGTPAGSTVMEGPASPISEAELLDILERETWTEADV